MNAAYAPPEWHDFFLAVSGAGAALAGLVFVALSINLREIIRGDGLVGRAGEAVTLLVSIVLVGLFGLAPDIIPSVLGGLIAIVGIAIWGLVTRGRWQGRAQIGKESISDGKGHAGPTREQWFWTLVVGEAGTVPFIVAGISLAAGIGGGLYWLLPGAAFLLVAAMLDAWVLLVEIVR
jgi:modulator of FtsH protease